MRMTLCYEDECKKELPVYIASNEDTAHVTHLKQKKSKRFYYFGSTSP